MNRYRIVEYISVFVGDDLMFTAKILFNKKKQEVISVTNNLLRLLSSILEGTRRDDI